MEPADSRTNPVVLGEASDCEDFEKMVRAYQPCIFRFALASLRDRDAAGSVTQDCLFNAFKARRQFRGDSSMRTWLMRIAVNLIRDAARTRRFQFWKRSAVGLDSASEWIPDRDVSAEDRALAKEQVEAIWRVSANLPDRQKTVFLLHFMEDMNAGEIEAATGISKAAIKVHLFRAVRAVRDKLRKRK